MKKRNWIAGIDSTRDEALPLDDFERYTNEEDEVGLFDSSVLFAASTMYHLVHLVRDLEITQGTLFAIAPDTHALKGRIICACDPDDKDYAIRFRLCHSVIGQLYEWCEWLETEYLAENFPYPEINPFANQFYEVAELLDLKMPTRQFLAALNDDNVLAKEMVKKFNELVSAMRQISSNAEIKKLRSNGITTAKADYNSLLEYQFRLFDVYSRLMIVRVDFGYLKEVARSIPPDDFLRHLKRFRVSLQRHSVFKYLVGYALKIEHGAERGFHVHGLFFYDGAEVQQDILRGKMIGEHWLSLMSEGMGHYRNRNGNKEQNFYNALGMVEYHERDKRLGLLYLIQYLMKTDSAARIMLGNSRTFLRGIMPELPLHNKGRERSKPDCSADLRAMLADGLPLTFVDNRRRYW